MKPVMHSEEWLLERVAMIPDAGCWIWIGSADPRGYGRVDTTAGRIGAHRVSYAVFKGPIPHGMWILHRCDVPGCINPAHLYAGTARDNVNDMYRRGRAPPRFMRGERHLNAVLTPQQVRDMRAKFADGVTRADLAAEYGIYVGHVSKIITRYAWRNVV